MSSQPSAILRPYTFTDLTETGYRIFKLYPAGTTEQDLEGELLVLSKPLPDPISHTRWPDPADGRVPRGYEALSWTWGDQKATYPLRIHADGEVYRINIAPNLESAFRALRKINTARYLWVDAICINQRNAIERSKQVPKMDRVYGNATEVCVWLGPGDGNSAMAVNFIQNEVLNLSDFDKLCHPSQGQNWAAFVELMTRPWFSRRWVIQEIALASMAKLYVGDHSIDWAQFATAVNLFVEDESATNRFSLIMKQNPDFDHTPNFFGDVAALGAARLVDATSNLFRSRKNGAREPLLALEYLVSDLPVFEASEPRDIIYALLAIARDTIAQSSEPPNPPPLSPDEAALVDMASSLPLFQELGAKLRLWSRRNADSRKYSVDYKAPIEEVYKDFMLFSIRRSDKNRALDIICRPWAPILEVIPDPEDATRTKIVVTRTGQNYRGTPYELPSWIRTLNDAAFATSRHRLRRAATRMDRRNANSLVGAPNLGTTAAGQRDYSAAGSKGLDIKKLEFKQRKTYSSMYVEGFELDEIAQTADLAASGVLPASWASFVGWLNKDDDPPPDFWRTLVADRGPAGRNPPLSYARACREAAQQGWGETLSTETMINEYRSTIVVKFVKRVRDVIWNRQLIKTSRGDLGLVNQRAKSTDRICILYGCSVPVVLRRIKKDPRDVHTEDDEDSQILEEKKRRLGKRLRDLLEERVRLKRLAISKKKQSYLLTARLLLLNSRYLIPVVVGLAVDYWRWPTIYIVLLVASLKLVAPKMLPSLEFNRQVKNSKAFRNTARWLYYARLGWPFISSVLAYILGFDLYIALLPITLILLFPNIFFSVYVDLAASIWEEQKSRFIALDSDARQGDIDRSEYWTLIGECYIHGMMNGEAIEYQKDAKIRRKRFEIR